MAYELIYQGEFSSIAENDYRLEILKKDYSGPFFTLPMSAVPVVQTWGMDEIKGVVKGCSLTIGYLNTGAFPIEVFYSNSDTDFKVIFSQGAQVLFVGFLVQDDIREPMIDYTHEVQLSANDSLGLIKDIEFDKTPTSPTVSYTTAQGDFIAITMPAQNWIYLRNSQYLPVVGTPFTITGHPTPLMNGTFTPTVVNVISTGNYNIRTNTFTGDTTAEACFINGAGGLFNFYGRNSLLSIINLCLRNTNLELESYVYENLYENNHNTASSSLAQTFIDVQSFISGEKFEDCYGILSKICDRFNLTLFQSLGRWNIIRWDELRLGASINGFIYDKDFLLLGTTTLDSDMLFGFQEDTYPEAGLSKSAVRPFKFVKETFNYRQPKYLLKNYDLQTLGALIRQYVSGTNTIYEYVAIGWESAWPVAPVAERFIRVVKDSTGTELDRALVLRGPTGDSARAIQSEPFEVSQGDKIKFSFSFQTNVSQSGSITIIFALRLTDGTTNRYVDELPAENGAWIGNIGFNYSLPSGGNTNQIQTVEISSSQIPFDGLIYCYLAQCTFSPQSTAKETIFRDIRLEYTPFINDSVKIIGHVHNDQQTPDIKNKEDGEIYADDSPRNSIQGTLFLSSFVGNIQKKTTLWHRGGVAESLKLGEITTREQLQWRSEVRTRMDGNFRGLIQSGKYVSMLTHFAYAQMAGLNFLFGNLQIDYRNNQFSCSATELFKDGEADIADDYTFTYLYDAT